MLQKLKSKLFALSAVIALIVPAVAVPATVMAATSPNLQNAVCEGGNTLQIPDNGNVTGTCAGLDKGNGTNSINNLLAQIINIFSVIVGVVAVIMMIVGGFRYVTSGGDSSKVGSAKNTILYALIGLVIAALAQIVVKFVLTKTTQ